MRQGAEHMARAGTKGRCRGGAWSVVALWGEEKKKKPGEKKTSVGT